MESRLLCGDEHLSIIGLGGLTLVGLPEQEAGHLVREAFEAGVNYFDVAPSYGDGEAEKRLGPALAGLRVRVFLACKTLARDAAGARKDLEASLRRLRTDRFDLYQFHSVSQTEEVDLIFGPGGAMETFEQARRDGQIRWIGFSAHSVTAALAMLDRYSFDSVMFPVNFVCWAQGDFGPQVVRRAREKGTACIALKAMAATRRRPLRREYPNLWYRPVTDEVTAGLALRFALSQGVTAAIPPSDEKLFRMALRIACDFRPLSDSERDQLMSRARGLSPLMRHRL